MEATNLNFLTLSIFLIISIIIFFLAFKSYRNQQKINKSFKLLAKRKYFFLEYIFLILAFFTLLFSIFWPRISSNITEKTTKWVDIIFVLDTSKSMSVTDVENYSRLDFAKKAIENFVKKRPNNNYALVVFAWDATSKVPLTNNTDFFLSTLQNVDYETSTTGTNFIKALSLANNRTIISEKQNQVIIFISDGGDEEDKINEETLRKLRNIHVKYFVAGVGTETWWRIILEQDEFWKQIFGTYNWEYVVSRLNEANLRQITNIFDGEYLRLEKYDDLSKFDENLGKIETWVLKLNDSKDATRVLTLASFFFFLIYLILYLCLKK